MDNGFDHRIRLKRHGASVGSLLVAVATLMLGACSGHGDAHLKAIKSSGTLVVLTRNAPTTYYIGNKDKPTGPEYDMAEAFAKSIGVKAKFVIVDSVADMLHALAHGKGDMVAGGITRTRPREKSFSFGPAYQTVTEQVVCRRGGKQADSIKQLSNVDLEVISDSSYIERLKALRASHPGLHWKVAPDADTEDLLRRIWEGRLDCTVADSDIVDINRRFFPNLVVTFNLSQPQKLAWVLPRGADGLRDAIDDWFEKYKDQGKLHHLMQRYYAHVKVFDYVDVRTYVRRIKSRYPRYRKLFRKAAKAHGLPPLVLAAQAYQESHWNPHARSPTGVRGMMMLTLSTARSLGIHNRLNARASIRGGARYLAHMESRLSDAINKQDRIWFALAAYNIGFAHLRDARDLARRLDKNPDAWSAMRTVLPLLDEKKYYRDLAHGYARGLEAVRYVRRIRNYADILREKTRAGSVAGLNAPMPGRVPKCNWDNALPSKEWSTHSRDIPWWSARRALRAPRIRGECG